MRPHTCLLAQLFNMGLCAKTPYPVFSLSSCGSLALRDGTIYAREEDNFRQSQCVVDDGVLSAAWHPREPKCLIWTRHSIYVWTKDNVVEKPVGIHSDIKSVLWNDDGTFECRFQSMYHAGKTFMYHFDNDESMTCSLFELL